MSTLDLHRLRTAMDHLVEVATTLGLRPPSVQFEIVSAETLYEVAAYHFPQRFTHWTHGAAYHRQKTRYDLGLERIYELVLNTDPCMAYLLDTNSEIEHKLVIAHVLGHADFFRRNVYFRTTDRTMHQAAERHGRFIRELEDTYGIVPVEKTLDAALALSFHVDPTSVGFREKTEEEQEYERLHPADPPTTPYDDVWNLAGKPAVTPERRPRRILEEPERDLLRFLARYSPTLEDWQRAVLDLVREEWLYFYPNMRTKVMNEGYASFWHERILENAQLTPDEHVKFRQMHVGVISSGHRYTLNPYAVGYRMWREIEDRWEHPSPEQTWYGRSIQRSGGEGLAKVFEVATTYRDSEFIRAFLTEKLVEDLDLYAYDFAGDAREGKGEWRVGDAPWQVVRDALAEELTSLGIPSIAVVDADYHRRGELLLRHDVESDAMPLDLAYARRTLEMVHRLWGKAVHLETISDGEEEVLTFP